MAHGLVWMVVSLLAGMLLGALATAARLLPRLAEARERAAALTARLDEAGAALAQLTALRAQLRNLRHDVRGILSPALLVSDRLLSHEEPHVRRAGEVMTRTVDRAVARLSEAKLDQVDANADLP